MSKRVVLILTHDAALDLKEVASLMRPPVRVRFLHRFALVLVAPEVLDEVATYCLRMGQLNATRYFTDVLDIWFAAGMDGRAPRRRNRFYLLTRKDREHLSREALSW